MMKTFLVLLLVFLALGGFYGGIQFVLQPDGSLLGVPTNVLQNSVFPDFLIPGILLLVIFGIFPGFTAYALLKKPESSFFQKLNIMYDYHFSWTFILYTGFALIIWINVQTFILNAVEFIHTFYSSYGILLICIALLPKTRKLFQT